NDLRSLRTWGLQLSGEFNGQNRLYLNLFSTRQVYPVLFLFLNVESAPLPCKEDNLSFTSLSRITEMMIRLAEQSSVSLHTKDHMLTTFKR
ncbi:7455_t:CDS:2, partial [Entrophospora sp. SA101]